MPLENVKPWFWAKGLVVISDWAFKTGVEDDLTKVPVASSCGTIKPLVVPSLQVLAIEFASSAGGVKTKVINLTVSRRILCSVELPEEDTAEGPARQGTNMSAILLDANIALLMVVLTAATKELVTNAGAKVMTSRVSVKAAI